MLGDPTCQLRMGEVRGADEARQDAESLDVQIGPLPAPPGKDRVDVIRCARAHPPSICLS